MISHFSFAIAVLAGACLAGRMPAQEPSKGAAKELKNPALPSSADTQLASADAVKALKQRSKYAGLDKQAVQTIAHSAKAHWQKQFSGFTYLRTEHFSAGGVSHWMSIWLHTSTGLEFALVPGGKYQMGSPVSEANRKQDEAQHWVSLDPFLIARTECTLGAWAKLSTAAGLKGAKFERSAQHPRAEMSPEQVETWCRTAKLMLPTEAQWEFMCRAGTTSAWAVGDKKSDLKRFANIGSGECPKDWAKVPGIVESWRDGYGAETAPVGKFAPNAFGLFDVHGNVAEWARDHYCSYAIEANAKTGSRGITSGERIARGGNFGCDASVSRSAIRFKCGSGISPGANHGFGFRPSMDLSF